VPVLLLNALQLRLGYGTSSAQNRARPLVMCCTVHSYGALSESQVMDDASVPVVPPTSTSGRRPRNAKTRRIREPAAARRHRLAPSSAPRGPPRARWR
jgi:hypothetical protein